MWRSAILSLVTVLISSVIGQGDNGQYTAWTPSTTQEWGYETTTTPEYWTPTTTSYEWTTQTTPYYDYTSYTTVTSCYTENGEIITITTWVPCPCDNPPPTIITDPSPIGTTTQTLITTTTPAYSTFTSNGIVYVVPISTPVTATASAGVEIVNASDASKSTEIQGWVGILSGALIGGVALVAVLL